eukprot:2656244-Amphidinium_carterae.3
MVVMKRRRHTRKPAHVTALSTTWSRFDTESAGQTPREDAPWHQKPQKRFVPWRSQQSVPLPPPPPPPPHASDVPQPNIPPPPLTSECMPLYGALDDAMTDAARGKGGPRFRGEDHFLSQRQRRIDLLRFALE